MAFCIRFVATTRRQTRWEKQNRPACSKPTGVVRHICSVLTGKLGRVATDSQHLRPKPCAFPSDSPALAAHKRAPAQRRAAAGNRRQEAAVRIREAAAGSTPGGGG